ncbi:hypothetical protein I7I50_08999 [Histoplasma capsulatum G186AR]|uniref:Uncharacterized protein n=1 Tax=Ajellomyces capsulatus TaxID=5037 RepID=A0A8H7YPC3_AJECA|nr:hypothetical protein I7I52_06514 [Histoplasma capsulatum]QSS74018.1 hypothetical protein I7I50_08999 [Histoplasma capsulatum G186AR]
MERNKRTKKKKKTKKIHKSNPSRYQDCWPLHSLARVISPYPPPPVSLNVPSCCQRGAARFPFKLKRHCPMVYGKAHIPFLRMRFSPQPLSCQPMAENRLF